MHLYHLISLFSATLLVQAAPQLDARAQCVKTGFENTKCCVEYGTDRPGGDYAKQRTGTLEKCVALCDTLERCESASYHQDSGFCYLKQRIPNFVPRGQTVSILCTKDPNTLCTRRPFHIKLTFNGFEEYFYDYRNDPSFISSTSFPNDAGNYTVVGGILQSESTPGTTIYSILGRDPGPNPPPNGRALFQGKARTFPPDIKEALPIKVTVIDQQTCQLAFTDGVRTVVGYGGFRGGAEAYIAPPGTTQNFQVPISINAVPLPS